MSTELLIVIFVILASFQMKHLICDYQLQTKYMLGKFNETGWALPLAAHSAVHAGFTVFLVFVITQIFWLAVVMAVFDFVVHFTMDRIKASPKLLGRYKIDDKRFWVALGVDQAVHHMTHYTILLTSMYVYSIQSIG